MDFVQLDEVGDKQGLHNQEFQQFSQQEDTMQTVVTTQPMAFSAANLDPPSQLLYQGVSSKHMSGEALMSKINGAGGELIQRVQGRFVSLKGNMHYNEFLNGLTLQDEVIVSSDPHLQYRAMTISDEFGRVLETRVGGRALLTDKRLLFLCSQYFQTSSLTEFGDAKKLPGGYTIEMSCKDSTYFKPIPLSHFRSIELDGRTGVSGSISMHASKPPCKGLLGCCGCLKSWNQTPLVYSEFNEMSLKLGVLMPPWDHKTFLTLHADPIVPIEYLKGFTANMQTMIRRCQSK